MCVNYVTVSRQMCFDWIQTQSKSTTIGATMSTACDYKAPFIIHDEKGCRQGIGEQEDMQDSETGQLAPAQGGLIGF